MANPLRASSEILFGLLLMYAMLYPIADDPYYCGMRARVPNFVSAGREAKGGQPSSGKSGQGQQGWQHNLHASGAAKENHHQMSGGVKARINSKQNAQQQVQL